MQYDLKKMKKEYDGKSIDQCVKTAKNFYSEMISKGEQLVGLLWYLEKTKRFREYSGYETLDFRTFVSEICHITYNRYRELAFAYNWYPDESQEFGPQTIQMLRSRVGVVKLPQVLKKLKTNTKNIDDPIKRREVITRTIDRFSPPKPKTAKEDTKSYWKSKYEKLYAEYKQLQKENMELKMQLERQKPAVAAFMKMQDTVQSYRQPAVH